MAEAPPAAEEARPFQGSGPTCGVCRTPQVGMPQRGPSAAGSFEAVLAYSLAPVFLDFMGFLASALKCCPSI